ncbi:hypothetical protein QC763_0066930 [Podospora pseudopauciseta]|uniref:Uncharacterized protein n=1 Tax=Podospora pseudopauciseta TaxID=2093780 RepID=A0ABR0HCS6_9PEZI|nr:hypothetical protein QC763_0066930 [Podospora pseudopauciseta]
MGWMTQEKVEEEEKKEEEEPATCRWHHVMRRINSWYGSLASSPDSRAVIRVRVSPLDRLDINKQTNGGGKHFDPTVWTGVGSERLTKLY